MNAAEEHKLQDKAEVSLQPCFNVKKKSSVRFQRVLTHDHHTRVSFDHLLLCRQLYFSN